MNQSMTEAVDDELTFFRAVYHSPGMGICVIDITGCFLLVNDAFCSIFGYNRKQLLKQPITKLIPSITPREVENDLRKSMAGDGEASYHWQGLHQHGTVINLYTTSKLVEISENRRFVVSTMLDVTQESESQRKLKLQSQEIERLSRIASLTINGVITTDKNGWINWINDGFTRISGYTLAELKDLRPGDVLQGEQTDLETVSYIGERLKAGKGFEVDILNYHKSNYAYWVHIDCTPLNDEKGQLLGYLALQTDITERRRVNRLLLEKNNLFHSIVETMNDGVVTIDKNGCILSFNLAAQNMFQYSWEEVKGRNVKCMMPDEYARNHDEYLWNYSQTGHGVIMGKSRELTGKRMDGTLFPLELSVTETIKDEEPLYVGMVRDITVRKANEERIEQLAFSDPLTQLANRRLLEDRLEYSMAITGRSKKHSALFFLDIDNFKIVNDVLGHAMGDQLLIKVARTMKGCLYEADTVARLGGDEFVMILADLPADTMTAARNAQVVAKRLLAELAQPFGNLEFQQNISCSLGIVLFTGTSVSAGELMRQADIAMYRAKSDGKNRFLFFDPAMQSNLVLMHRTESELRDALGSRELEPYYQAQVDACGRLIGAEVLIRWNHPERGLLAPNDFIGVAESSGLIVPIGYQVFAMACSQLVAWSSVEAARELTLAVNISARQFEEADFTYRIAGILKDTGANPKLLKLEITESTLAKDIESVSSQMRELKKIGIVFSLDDFGTGYSSLAYLKRLPIAQLKVDQCFVRDLLFDKDNRAIIDTIISLSTTLGIDVIAEGVEEAEQKNLLATMGCRSFQGYLFGKPEPVSVFEHRFVKVSVEE